MHSALQLHGERAVYVAALAEIEHLPFFLKGLIGNGKDNQYGINKLYADYTTRHLRMSWLQKANVYTYKIRACIFIYSLITSQEDETLAQMHFTYRHQPNRCMFARM